MSQLVAQTLGGVVATLLTAVFAILLWSLCISFDADEYQLIMFMTPFFFGSCAGLAGAVRSFANKGA